jgi:hypothetical protein
VTVTEHIPEMFKATFSERKALEADVKIRNRPGAEFDEPWGLELTRLDGDLGPKEEAISSKLTNKVPGIKGSNNGFITMMNLQRAHALDAARLAYGGPVPLEAGRALANAVNVLSGRGNPGKGRVARAVEAAGLILWAPRRYLSQFQTLTFQPLYRGNARTRLIAANMYARSLLGISAFYGLVRLGSLMFDDDDPEKPRIGTKIDADLGKIRVGDKHIDPFGGLLQMTVILSKLGIAVGHGIGIGEPAKSDKHAEEDFWHYMRMKISPMIGTPLDILKGENVIGQKVTVGGLLKRTATFDSSGPNLLPMALNDIMQAIRSSGNVPIKTALAITAPFGMRLQVYSTAGREQDDILDQFEESAKTHGLSGAASQLLAQGRALHLQRYHVKHPLKGHPALDEDAQQRELERLDPATQEWNTRARKALESQATQGKR